MRPVDVVHALIMKPRTCPYAEMDFSGVYEAVLAGCHFLTPPVTQMGASGAGTQIC